MSTKYHYKFVEAGKQTLIHAGLHLYRGVPMAARERYAGEDAVEMAFTMIVVARIDFGNQFKVYYMLDGFFPPENSREENIRFVAEHGIKMHNESKARRLFPWLERVSFAT